MNYEKDIETMQFMRRFKMNERHWPAIDAAIELMLGAKPKDAEAELALCKRTIAEIAANREDCANVLTSTLELLWTALAKSREQARAEGYAHGRKNLDEVCERADEQELLIGRLRREADEQDQELDAEIAAHNKTRDQLAAAQAEIKRLEALNKRMIPAAVAEKFDTKLNTLIAAAERVQAIWDAGNFSRHHFEPWFKEAIEAAKKP